VIREPESLGRRIRRRRGSFSAPLEFRALAAELAGAAATVKLPEALAPYAETAERGEFLRFAPGGNWHDVGSNFENQLPEPASNREHSGSQCTPVHRAKSPRFLAVWPSFRSARWPRELSCPTAPKARSARGDGASVRARNAAQRRRCFCQSGVDAT